MVDVSYGNPGYQRFNLQKIIVSGKSIDQDSRLPDVDVRYEIAEPDVKFSRIPQNDIACLISPRVINLLGNDKPSVSFPLGHGLVATNSDLNDEINVCDFVAFPGYPDWHDKKQRRPILRTGTLSSDPRYDYHDPDGNYIGQCIAYEAFSSAGSSGSPVFALQIGLKPGVGITFSGYRPLKLVGINAGHLPAKDNSHSGISIMYKSSAILDIIDG